MTTIVEHFQVGWVVGDADRDGRPKIDWLVEKSSAKGTMEPRPSEVLLASHGPGRFLDDQLSMLEPYPPLAFHKYSPDHSLIVHLRKSFYAESHGQGSSDQNPSRDADSSDSVLNCKACVLLPPLVRFLPVILLGSLHC